jgi:hypothetical protein
MELDTTGWSGEGDFTVRLLELLRAIPEIALVRVEDAPASRADAGFSFISNELFVAFATTREVRRRWRFGVLPGSEVLRHPLMTLASLQTALSGVDEVGEPDYADEGMLQYLRTQRIIPPYQTKGYKLVELVRIYEAKDGAPRDRKIKG